MDTSSIIRMFTLLVGIVFSFASLLMILRQLRFLSKAVTTFGAITEVDTSNDIVRLSFSYEINGVQFHVKDQSAIFSRLNVGNTLQVAYDPQHPSQGKMKQWYYHVHSPLFLAAMGLAFLQLSY